MRVGVTSRPGLYTIKAIIENYKAWKVNGLNPNLLTFLLKPLSKIRQFRIKGVRGKGRGTRVKG